MYTTVKYVRLVWIIDGLCPLSPCRCVLWRPVGDEAPRGSSFCLGSTGYQRCRDQPTLHVASTLAGVIHRSFCQLEQMNLAAHNLLVPLRDTVMSCVRYSSVTLRRPRTSNPIFPTHVGLSICRGFNSVHKARRLAYVAVNHGQDFSGDGRDRVFHGSWPVHS